MKIYSLQEENDKLNASRGITQPGINHGMFDMKKTTAPARQQKKTVSSTAQRGKWTSSTTQQRQMTSSSQPRRIPTPPQEKPPQNQNRRLGLLIGWIILMLFLFLVSFISEMF